METVKLLRWMRGPWRLATAVALLVLASAPALAKTKVACIGASTTQGSGAPSGQSYPDQLAKLLGAEYEVRNFGKSGAGALKAGDPTYWNSAEFNAATAYAPDLVINWLGGADSKAASWDRHKGQFLQNYQDMIKHFQDLPTHPRVISMLSIALHDDAGVRKVVLEGEVNPLQRQGAQAMGSPMVDLKAVVDGHPEYFTDGVHLKAIGYAAVAKAAHTAVLALAAPDAGAPLLPDASAPVEASAAPSADAGAPSPADAAASPTPDAATSRPDSARPEPEPEPEPAPKTAKAGGCAVGGSPGISWLFLLVLAPLVWRRRILMGGLLVLATIPGLARAESSPAEAARRDANVMAQALISGDLQKFATFNYPALVKQFGGREKMVSFLQQSFAEMKKQGFTMKSAKVTAPEQVVTAGKELHALVPMTVELSAPGGTMYSDGHLVGISADKGRTWTFIDSSKLDEATRKLVLPAYNPVLKIPPKKEPRFVPK